MGGGASTRVDPVATENVVPSQARTLRPLQLAGKRRSQVETMKNNFLQLDEFPWKKEMAESYYSRNLARRLAGQSNSNTGLDRSTGGDVSAGSVAAPPMLAQEETQEDSSWNP
mmetsp:Transcript_45938/g.85684  ORF Transcript_45938/g.85684 Transcript_45938/m.85684 type:complete len:113 (+) Transcript_45938:45-383(+)